MRVVLVNPVSDSVLHIILYVGWCPFSERNQATFTVDSA